MTVDLSNWNTKAQTSPEKFFSSTLRWADTASKVGRERPFNYQSAVDQFRGWIYAAVWMNAKAISGVPLRLYVRKRGGEKLVNSRNLKRVLPRQKSFMTGRMKRHPSQYVLQKTSEWGEDFEEVTDKTPILELLQNPNPYVLGYELSCMRHMMASLTGNCYMHPVLESASYKGQTLNRVKQLWIMPSQWVKIMPASPDQDELIAGYMYGADRTREKFFPPDEVMHLKFPNPRNVMYGLGQVEAAFDAQKLSIAQRQTDQARYDNLSRPDLAVIMKSANMNMEKVVEMQNEWLRLFRGTFRQGNPVFLTGDTQVIPLNWQPTEIGDREIIVEELAAVFGVPVSLLKANDPNLASAQVGFATWRENTILPYCRIDEEFLNKSLMPVYGIEDDAFLCYDDPVPENRDEIRQDNAAGALGAWLTRNEIRVGMGLEPVEDENADKLLVSAGLMPIDQVGQNVGGMWSIGSGDARGTDSGGKDDPSEGEDGGEPEDTKTFRESMRQRDIVYGRIVHKNVSERDGEKEKPIREMKKALNRIFAEQRKEAVAIMSGRKADDLATRIANLLMNLRKYNPDIANAVQPFLTDQIVNGGIAGLDSISLPKEVFEVNNPKVAEFIRHYTVKLAGEVNEYTAKLLSETLSEGLAAGEAGGTLAHRVTAVYDDFDGYRSEMIARTESARAYTAGTEEAWHQSGMVKAKKWKLAPGACLICGAIAAKSQVPLNEAFYPLGATIPLPGGKSFQVDYSAIHGPPAHPHCVCGITAVIGD